MLTTMRTLGIAVAMVVFAAACSSDSGEPLSHKLEELNSSIEAVASATASHEQAIASADTLGAMSAEEAAHGANVEAVHEEMHHLMDDMGMCGHGDEKLDLAALDETIEALEAEQSEHVAAMGAAVDVAAARTEESRHQARVTELVSALHGHHEGMEADSADFMCEADAH